MRARQQQQQQQRGVIVMRQACTTAAKVTARLAGAGRRVGRLEVTGMLDVHALDAGEALAALRSACSAVAFGGDGVLKVRLEDDDLRTDDPRTPDCANALLDLLKFVLTHAAPDVRHVDMDVRFGCSFIDHAELAGVVMEALPDTARALTWWAFNIFDDVALGLAEAAAARAARALAFALYLDGDLDFDDADEVDVLKAALAALLARTPGLRVETMLDVGASD